MKKQTLAPFEAAVFDMDGTLLYSMHIWEQLIQDFLVEQKVRPSEGLREALRPLNMEDTAVYLKQEYGMAETPAQIIDGITAFAHQGGVSSGATATLLKITGVSLLADFAARTCRDAGEDGIAAHTELAGRILILTMALPSMRQLMELILSVAS